VINKHFLGVFEKIKECFQIEWKTQRIIINNSGAGFEKESRHVHKLFYKKNN